jgi:two-component system cell cycle response regulator
MLTNNPNVPLMLLVEDDENHADLMKTSLQGAGEEYRLEIVGTLNNARSAIERQPPDLILTDYRLPDGNGSELVATVNGLCPVILLTSQGNEQVAVDAMKAGAQDYVVKTSAVFSAISRIVQRSLREWALIQERKQAEKLLISTFSLLNATLESTADGIIVVDVSGRIQKWNQKFIDMWNLPEELLYAQNRATLLNHFVSQLAQAEKFLDTFRELCENPEKTCSDALSLADGRKFRWYSQPQRIGAEVVGRVWSFDDITDQIRGEEALEESNRRLEVLSTTDSLTGIANRRRFDEVLSLEYARHARSECELSLLMLDIDHFKEYNDRYGHVKGDECLRQIARVIADCEARAADLAARFGGDEFACILPDTNRKGAVAVAEKIRLGVIALAIPHQESNVSDCVTVSLGGATVQCSSDGSVVDLVAQVDELLYRAKSSGRNRVEF